jgi:sigma-B regulation protein RsbU (phosphoserine phosphatase)
LCQTTEPSNYATLLFASVDPATGSLLYANAGHVPGLVVESSGTLRWLEEGGTPVGLVPGAEYASEALTLEPGAAFVLCSDGVTEAESAAGEPLDTEGLASIVKDNREKSAHGIASAVFSELARFHGGEPNDDTTLIVIKRVAPPVRARNAPP